MFEWHHAINCKQCVWPAGQVATHSAISIAQGVIGHSCEGRVNFKMMRRRSYSAIGSVEQMYMVHVLLRMHTIARSPHVCHS